MYTQKVAPPKRCFLKVSSLFKQTASFEDNRDSAVLRRQMIQCIKDQIQPIHENGCGCAGCVTQRIESSRQQSLSLMGKAVQRTVNYNGVNYNHGNWMALWLLLNWNTPANNRGWLIARQIKGREVRELIRESCRSNEIYNLGGNRDTAYNWVQGIMKGLVGLTGANNHGLAALDNLTNEALAVKGLFRPSGQEFQSMDFEGHRFTTGNRNDFIVPQNIGGRNLLNYAQQPPIAANNIIRATGFPEHSHAEIILLAKVIRYVLDVGFPTQTILLAGRRLPCGHCQQIINRFIIANQGRIELDYIKAQEFGAPRIGAQVADPGDYTNALQKLVDDTVITDASINAINGLNAQERKSWLKRILVQVINFTPRQVRS